MSRKQKYLSSEAHGYLLEADACALLVKELARVCAKLQRRIDKEAQYYAYLDVFRRGRQALEEHTPTVSEMALSITKRVLHDLESDQQEFAFCALTPEQQAAELLRADQSRKEWKARIAQLQEQQRRITKGESENDT